MDGGTLAPQPHLTISTHMKRSHFLTISAAVFTLLSVNVSAQTPLKNGISVRDAVNKSRLVHYTIQVPENAQGLEVSLANVKPDKDTDLYIRKDGKPTRDQWDFRPFVQGANELVIIDANSIPKLVPGATYHIAVGSQRDKKAEYSLRAAFILPNSDGGTPSATRRYRITWVNDPATTATVAWEQISGEAGTVYYDTQDHGTDASKYTFKKSVDREINHFDMRNCFVRLEKLQPDTKYYFVIQDQSGTSNRYYFQTAATEQKPFSFCAGGDSRNFREPRQQANRLVAKLRPLFVAFTGDMINQDISVEWQEWLDDWQQTITPDGRIIPILPHRGNHERNGNTTIYNLFDTTPDNYYALNFSRDLMRFYVLNSEISAGGEQLEWLQADLRSHSSKTRHLVAGYHKPMRPVVAAKKEGTDEYDHWAPLFYLHGVDLVFESDSHAVKRTKPVKPFNGEGSTEGFIESPNDPKATVYTGEGCWGAPLRAAQDLKPWIAAAGTFNSFDWTQVYEDRIELRTVKVSSKEAKVGQNTDETPFNIPANLELWEPESGKVLTVPGD